MFSPEGWWQEALALGVVLGAVVYLWRHFRGPKPRGPMVSSRLARGLESAAKKRR